MLPCEGPECPGALADSDWRSPRLPLAGLLWGDSEEEASEEPEVAAGEVAVPLADGREAADCAVLSAVCGC